MAVALAHAAALAVVPPLALAPAVKLAVALAIFASLAHAMARHVLLRTPGAIRLLLWAEDDRWQLHTAGRRESEARLLPSSFCHPQLVVLNFARHDRRGWCSVVLLPDSLDADTMRRLRVRLRLSGAGAPDTDQQQA